MSIKVKSNVYTGIEAMEVEIEIDIGRGLPGFYLIGLGDAAVLESRERVKTALKNIGVNIGDKKIIVNLSPASIRKEGSHFDFGIATGILMGFGKITDSFNILENYLLIGELSLDGRVKGVNGAISSAILAKELGYRGIIVSTENYNEALLIPNIDIIPIEHLNNLNFLFENPVNYIKTLKLKSKVETNKTINNFNLDFSDVKGQQTAKRAIEIAISGGHNILLIGSPGSGKTMLAKRVTSIIPPMTTEEIIQCTKIYSISGELHKSTPLISTRPFRAPHHTASPASIIGGGRNLKVGEITLAHNGVLFLDEFYEFSSSIIETLRQPMEDGVISISRLGYKTTLPSNFILLAAANPCKCGLLFEKNGSLCTCSQPILKKYNEKISGPILDRIDIIVEIKKLSEDELLNNEEQEKSSEISRRVTNVRNIQLERFKNKPIEKRLNANMSTLDIETFCLLNSDAEEYLKKAINLLNLSPRGYYKILKVSRTIADLDNSLDIELKHILESLNYRKKDYFS